MNNFSKTTEVTQIEIPFIVHAITCHKCKMTFSILAIMPFINDLGDKVTDWMHQSANYCPYCGTKQENE